MQKVIAKESVKLLKLGTVGFLLIIVVVVAGGKLTATEMIILGITPYIVYQLYCAYQRATRRKKK